MKQENDELEDDKQVLDSADLRDLFETSTEKLFRCNVCLKSYAKITSYEAHLRIHNNIESQMVCHVCGAHFTCLQELKIHISTHNKSNSIFPCKLCGHVFPSLAARKRHKLVHLHTPEWTCEICSRKFKQHSFYIDHVLMHKLKNETETSFVCSICGLHLECKKDLEAHEKVHEDIDNKENEDVDVVEINHAQDEENQEASDVILLPFQNETEIDLNIAAGTSDVTFLNEDFTIVEIPTDEASEFICGECGKECPDIAAVNAHMEEHVQIEGYECTDCKEVFQYKYLLLQHVRNFHAAHRPFTCDICSTSFTSKNGLKNHRTIHLPLRFPCDECGNVFKGRSGLYLHKQRVHRGRKDFACDYCGKQFALKCQRDNHQRVHTGEKPFKCETCGAGFKAQSGLYAHRRTHTDLRPYKCEICGKHLRLPYNLRLHMRTHTGEKPYVCDICGRAFSQPGDCKKHKKTHRKNNEESMAGSSIDDKPEFVDVTYLTYELDSQGN